MGASDQTGQRLDKGVPQEIVTIPREVDPDTQESMRRYIVTAGFPSDRFEIRFDTWKTLYITPPDDQVQWTKEERDELKKKFDDKRSELK